MRRADATKGGATLREVEGEGAAVKKVATTQPTTSATLPRTFGETLRHYRLARGLTQAALAERAGLSPRGVNDLERGARTHPRRDTIALLADA
ncbi:MAG TPA: helix-turn-helix transcriptional regulator, partial [Ktedonobacterales bacterium]